MEAGGSGDECEELERDLPRLIQLWVILSLLFDAEPPWLIVLCPSPFLSYQTKIFAPRGYQELRGHCGDGYSPPGCLEPKPVEGLIQPGAIGRREIYLLTLPSDLIIL